MGWDEDRTKYAPLLLLAAASFRPDCLFDCTTSLDWRAGVPSPTGKYLYSNRILPAGTPLGLSLSPSKEGVVLFDGDVVIPTLFDLTGRHPDPWMSVTPMEMITQRPGIRRASGEVVVGGLGLGWFLRKVHDRPKVEYLRDIWKRYGECLDDDRLRKCRRLFRDVWGWGQEVAEATKTGARPPRASRGGSRRSVA